MALDSNELQRELKNYENDLADIQNGEEEIVRIRADVELAGQAGNALDELIKDIKYVCNVFNKRYIYSDINMMNCRNTIVKIQQQLNIKEVDKKRIKNDEDALVAKCLQVAKEVQDAQQENCKKLKELHSFYATDHISPVFIHQMRMSQIYEHCDSFVKHLELCLQMCFKVEVRTTKSQSNNTFFIIFFLVFFSKNNSEADIDDESTGNEQQIAIDLDLIKTKIFKSTLELTRQQTKLAGHKSINANISNKDCWVMPSAANLENETAELRRKNEEYYRFQVETAQDSLKTILHHLAGLEVETAAFDNTESKLNRGLERLRQIRTIKSIVSEELMNAELLWMLMQFDIEKLRHRSQLNVQELYQTQNMALHHRMDLMRQALKTPSDVIAEHFLLPLNSMIASHLDEPVDIDQETFQLYDKLLNCIRDNMRKLEGNQDKRLMDEM